MSSLSLIKSQKYDEIKSRENFPLPQKVSVLKIREKYSKQEMNLSHHQSIKACLTYINCKTRFYQINHSYSYQNWIVCLQT